MPGRILIADDEPAIAMSLEFLFGRNGYETRTAVDGEAALATAKLFLPHLIVLDLMLPRLSGLEVCRALRADKTLNRIKILMLTARGGAADVERGHTAGVDAYQVKPFSTHDLLAQVQGLMSESETVHASRR